MNGCSDVAELGGWSKRQVGVLLELTAGAKVELVKPGAGWAAFAAYGTTPLVHAAGWEMPVVVTAHSQQRPCMVELRC
jgi:hypothetical protein